MTVVFAIAMALLAAAPLAALAAVGRADVHRVASALSVLGCVLLVIVGVTAALGGAHPTLALGSWLGFGASALRADGLAGIFLAITGLTGAAVGLAHLEVPTERWQSVLSCTLLLFVAVAIGATNGFLFLLAWESLTVCVYLIATSGGDRPGMRGGYLTGGLAKLGGAALLAAFAILYAHTHSFSLDVWAHASIGAGTRGLLFVLLLACFATKIGVLPLQGGLPAGYDSAPRLGAASLSVALCAGFYGLWRFEFQILGPLPPWCGDALLIIAALTALAGIAYALAQDSLRRFLGYSSVEHAGVVLMGLAVALLGQAAHKPVLAAAGLLAATLHVVAHNLAKTLALIGIDRVGEGTGRHTIDPLGGLARRLPRSAFALGISTLTLAAIPPLGGFVSEWFTFQALLQAFRMPTLLSQALCALAAAALALTAGLGVLAFTKYYSFIFLGAPRSRLASAGEPSRRAPSVVLLGAVVLFLGALAPWEIRGLGAALQGLLGFDVASTAVTSPLVLGPVFANFSVLAPTWLAVVLPVYVLLALAIVYAFGGARRGRVRRAPVWVTGSGAELAAVQYRPSAFSNPMRVILRGPMGYRSRLATPADSASSGEAQPRGSGVAPLPRLERSVVLAVERFIYEPAARLALGVAARVRAFQSGRLSAYLLYMLIALTLALILVPILG